MKISLPAFPKKLRSLISLLAVMALFNVAHAAPPATITYQGYLTSGHRRTGNNSSGDELCPV